MYNCPNGGKSTNNLYQDYDELMASEAFEEFLDYKLYQSMKPLSVETIKTYKNHFNYFMKVIGGDKDIREISTYDYNCFKKNQLKQGLSPATINSYGNTLRSFFNWCYDQGKIFYRVTIPKYVSQTKAKQIYTEEEIVKLLKKPKKNCTFKEYKIWVMENLALCTGLRISSMLAIRIEDVNLNDGSIIINTTKNKKCFKTYVNNEMKNILKEYYKF